MNIYKNKLTIIIYAHDRQYYLNRVCDYYKELIEKYGIRIFISDSSKESWIDSAKYPEFIYKHYGSNLNIEKFLLTLEKVETEYVLLAPDDDFYIKSSIIECLVFLMSNPQYSVAHGEFLRFDSSEAKLVNSLYAKKHYVKFTTSGYEFKSAKDRILNYFDVDNFLMINHSIVRTKPMIDSLKIRSTSKGEELRASRFSDAQFAFMQLIEGNIKVLPCVYALRDIDRMFNTGDVPKELSPHKTFDEFPDVMLNNYDPYSPLLAEKDNLTIEKASFIFGMAIQKLVTGRQYHKYIRNNKYECTFPSETGKYTNDINEVILLIKKYREFLPNYSKPDLFLVVKKYFRARLVAILRPLLNIYNCLSGK